MAIDKAWEGKLIDIVERAGAEILKIYASDFSVQNKDDESPLTQADLASHRVIIEGLTELTPDIPIISEESEPPSYEVRRTWPRYWLVDPLDGTKEFVNRNGEFTVNIAFIEGGLPTFGIVGVPVQGKIYLGDVEGARAWVLQDDSASDISGRQPSPSQGMSVVASRSHGGERLEDYLDALEAKVGSLTRTPVGSSLKLCVLAAGEADCYPRLGPTSEWDIGAAHAILRAAGGEVYTFDRSVLAYNAKESFLNPEFIAVGRKDHDWWGLLPELPPAG